MIMHCNGCAAKRSETPAAKYQDETHGKNMRVFNPGGTAQARRYGCTICGTYVNAGSDLGKRKK